MVDWSETCKFSGINFRNLAICLKFCGINFRGWWLEGWQNKTKQLELKFTKLIADTFNNYFADIKKTLKLKKHPNFDGQSLSSITDYLKNNEIVIKIKEKYNTQENSFWFTLFSNKDFLKR